MLETEPLITFGKAKATMEVATGVSVSQQLVGSVLNTLEYSRVRRVLVYAQSSCTEIATIAFLERHDRYEARGRLLVFASR